MHADYFKFDCHSTENEEALQAIKNIVTTVDVIYQMSNAVEAYSVALTQARKHTSRNKILVLTDAENAKSNANIDENFAIIPAGDAGLLCETIANSALRIAAIVVKYHLAAPLYYKRVRELSSAEGAVMIWDEANVQLGQADQHLNIPKNSQPDLICFELAAPKASIWIGGRKDILAGA